MEISFFCVHYTLHSFPRLSPTFNLTLLFPFSSDYGTTDKAKSISLKVLNKDNCQEVIDSNKEVEKTKAKEVEKTKAKEDKKTEANKGGTEQVFEIQRSTGGLYPDLSLLTDG